jgi:hypothetical protein
MKNLTLSAIWCISAVSIPIGVFAGCRRGDEATAADTSHAAAVWTTNRPLPTLFDGFEQGHLADFWLPGSYGSGLYVPGAINLSTNYARSGGHSVKITVREGDVEAAGDAFTRVERAELDSGHFALRGREAWYGFSLLVPKTFPVVDTRLVISSCKQSDVGRPIVAQRYRNGKHSLTVESQGRRKEYQMPPITQGQWADMIFHVRYSPTNDGLVEVWMDGKRVVAYSGPAAEAGAKDAFYNKIGLYRDRLKQPMTIYFDNYSVGPDKDSVDPARMR